jgi:hypothetical protein
VSNAQTETKLGKVAGVDVNEVKVAVLRRAAKAVLGAEMADTSIDGIKATIKALAEKFKKLPAERQATCDDCGGMSDAEMDACPFCGADGVSADEKDDASPGSDPPPARDNDEGASPDDEEHASAAASEKKNGKAGKTLAIVSGGGTVSAKSLDTAIDEFKRIRGEGAQWAWKLGRYVHDRFYKAELWKLRTDEKGKPKYKGFNQFVTEELGFTPRYWYALMEISENVSEEEAKVLESAKTLRLVVALEPETRKRILEEAKAGKQPRPGEIRDLLSSGKRRKKKGRQAAAAEANAEKAKARVKTLTMLIPIEKQRVKLWARPAKAKDEPRPAKRLADQPFFVVEGTNGVRLEIAIHEGRNGQLEATIVPARDEE